MPKAIRIDKSEMLNARAGEWHFDIVCRYQAREHLTDDQLDAMIEAGRIEFGGTYWNVATRELAFTTNEAKNDLYKSKKDIDVGI